MAKIPHSIRLFVALCAFSVVLCAITITFNKSTDFAFDKTLCETLCPSVVNSIY